MSNNHKYQENITKSDNNEERKIYADMLFHYSEQLKSYEVHTGNFSLTIWAALVVILAIIFETNSTTIRIIGIIAISCLESIFTFCFSYYSQRISYFRGYCIKMEQKLDEIKTESNSMFYFHHNCVCLLDNSFDFSGKALEGLLLVIGSVCMVAYTILAIPEFKSIIEYFSSLTELDSVVAVARIGKLLGLVIGVIVILVNIILIFLVSKGVTGYKNDIIRMNNKQPQIEKKI